ncbi:hypothetical protein GCM10011344_47540 [Dokdonia pacifica]|uniref:Lipocalin-like domain-containing protein n=1 Tax=Dokdonia pacifica TaxID=1627892 RepID=A0A239DUB3_9FLAO|nr:hypothetical protein [Dokdonia pacifica]GGG41153.1 hypothetical protein GCM10011344_47540 [Dokdonia pacifica]SNS35829.1 hypothetical protein SAMN06265376_11258 [Dokdonia pacifica]
MKVLVIVLFLFIITGIISCQNSKNNSQDLFGKWKCHHKELEDGTTKSTDIFSDEEFEFSCNRLTIILKSDFTGSESLSESNFKYHINDSILTLGNRQYIIEKLTNTELIIRDYDSKQISLSTFRQKLKKVK